MIDIVSELKKPIQPHLLPSFSNIEIPSLESQVDRVLQENRERLDKLLQKTPTQWDEVVLQLEDMQDNLDVLWNPISHLHGVKNEVALRAVYKTCLLKISDYLTDLGQNEALYQLFLKLQTMAETPAQRKFVENRLQDFKLSGAALGAVQKEQFKTLQKRLVELTHHFEENVLDATQSWSFEISDVSQLEGMPEYAIELCRLQAQKKGKEGYSLALDFPIYVAVMRYANHRELRELIYKAYVTKGSLESVSGDKFDNTPIMDEILLVRNQIAQLLGHSNYAELSIQTKMVNSTQEVLDFLYGLADKCRIPAKQEFAQLAQYAADLGVSSISPWDLEYFREKYRKQHFEISQEDLRPYFPQDEVIPGMFHIAKHLYGISAQEVLADTWHSDVKVFEFTDEAGKLRGYIYFDLYARENKRSGAWMDECRARRQFKDKTIQHPVAFLTCNFTPPLENEMALLTHDEVLTLFHEMGHCLHHILSQVNVMGVSGIQGVPWDAVELPSQFFENWCWEDASLQLFAKHVTTKEPLPSALFDKLLQTKNYHSAMGMIRQLEFSLFDFEWHLKYTSDNPKHIQDVIHRIRSKIGVFDVPSYNRFQNSFLHIFAGGYAAGYYSYKWAEVLSSDAFSLFEEKGLLNGQVGRSFMKHILEKGGSENIIDLFVAFRGREPNIEALLRHSGIE